MPVRRLNHAVLYVCELSRTVDFYTTMLGFEVRTEIPGRAAFLRAPDSSNDHDLGLFAIGPAAAGPARPQVGLYHLAWEVGTLRELAEMRDRLSAAGRWSAPAITGSPSRCTPRTPTASSSR